MPNAAPTPPPPSRDALLAAFREKAGPILAKERGLTSGSLVKLTGIARELGLPEGELDRAIRDIVAAPKRTLNPEAEKLRNRLRKDLAGRHKTIIGPEIEAKIVASASQKYLLDQAAILQVLSEVAAELGLRRITGDEAVAHFVSMVDDAVGDATWMARQSWDRLRLASEKWGLTFEDADELIRQKLDANRQASFRGKLMGRMVTIGTVVAVAATAIFLYVLFWGPKDRGTVPVTGTTVTEGTTTVAPPTPTLQPAWWDTDLTLAVTTSRREVADVSGLYAKLISASPAERGGAYIELVNVGARLAPDTMPREHIAEVIAGLHALEPDDGAASQLRGALFALVPAADKPLTHSSAIYEQAFWGVDLAFQALRRKATPELTGRREALAAALSSALGVTISPDAGPAMDAKSSSALTHVLFQHLIAGAAKKPEQAPALREYLLEKGTLQVTPEEMEQLDASFLSAVVLADEANWRNHEALFARLVYSKNPLITLRLLDLYQRVKNPVLQMTLGEELVKHTSAKPRSGAPKDVARAVRQALGAAGVSAAQSQEDRWDLLRSQADAALESPAPRATEHRQLLKDAVQFARLATLAGALSQGEAGIAVFDELEPKRNEDAVKPEATDPYAESPKSGPPKLRPLTNREKLQLEQYIAGIRAYEDETPVVRANSLRALSLVAHAIPDLTHEQAASVARYLLAEKSDAEQGGLAEPMQKLRRLKHLRLALADQIETARLTSEQRNELARAFLDDSAESSGSAEQLRRALLQSVYSELAAAKSAGPKTEDSEAQAMQQAAEDLAQIYRDRARIAGVGAADFHAAQSPAQGLELLVAAIAKDTPAAKEKPGPSPTPPPLADRLAVARFLGSHDLKKTVLLQRLIIELAAQRVSLLRPKQAEGAALILAELETADAKAENLLVQLRAGELATLKLGMLYGIN